MELLDGEKLTDLLSRLKRIPVTLAVDILQQVCNGLEYAHQHGIIHRDVTPDNIFLLPGNRVKVIDFGLACQTGTEDFDLAGTASYMSPEQIEGDPVDSRTDIYSLGVMAYEMITGRNPFKAENTRTVLDKHLNEDIPDPGKIFPDMPKKLRNFILNAARRSPDQRYQSVKQAIEDLKVLAEQLGLPEKHVSRQKLNMTNLFLIYKDDHRKSLAKLIEEFNTRVKELGVVLKISDFQDL